MIIQLDSSGHYPTKQINVTKEEKDRLDQAKQEHGCIHDALYRDKEFAEWYNQLLKDKENITFPTYIVYA